jgi:hypothetical protein
MGSELPCRATMGDRSGAGKALLETNELVFRGDKKDFRFRIAFEDIKKVVALGDRLVIDGPKVHAVLELGAKYAARWAEKIKNPPTRLDKLGIAEGTKMCVVGVDDPQFRSEVEARGAKATWGKLVDGVELVFFGVEKGSELPRLGKMKESLAPAGGVWVVRPKGAAASAAGVGEAEVRAAAKAAGLVDVKVCAFSATHTADKYVIPVAKR